MKTRAAVAFEAGRPLEVVEVDLAGSQAGEVLVELKTTGVCHTDKFTRSRDDPEGAFPAILGHEGAGIVKEIGKGVTSVEVGDHVILLYAAECRTCEYCLNAKTNLCQRVRETQGKGVMPDGTSRFRGAGTEISTRPFQLATGRSWRGAAFGGARGRTDVPKTVDMYMDGRIDIDNVITHTMPLDDIERAFDLMPSGESIRNVVLY